MLNNRFLLSWKCILYSAKKICVSVLNISDLSLEFAFHGWMTEFRMLSLDRASHDKKSVWPCHNLEIIHFLFDICYNTAFASIDCVLTKLLEFLWWDRGSFGNFEFWKNQFTHSVYMIFSSKIDQKVSLVNLIYLLIVWIEFQAFLMERKKSVSQHGTTNVFDLLITPNFEFTNRSSALRKAQITQILFWPL